MRDDEGALRAYRNVCRHRGSRLLSGSGQCKAAIRCRYHGWTYRLDGSLIGVPEGMAFGEKLDKPSLGLMPVRVEEMCGLVFVNLDPDAAPLAELVGDLPQRLAPYRIETLEPFAPAERHPAGQLEGRRRQLHRGLPHPHRPPGADADARLQALRRRGQRALRVVRRAAARQAAQQPARAAVRPARHADAGPARARPDASGATSTSTPTRRSTCTPTRSTPGRCCPTAWPAPATCSASYRPASAEPAHPVRAVGQPAPQHPRARRGHRPRRQRPAGAADARLPLRAAVGARGGRRLVRRPHPGRPGAGDGGARVARHQRCGRRGNGVEAAAG